MSDELTVVFRSASDIEARVVRGLLETHGIASLLSSDLSRSIFPAGRRGDRGHQDFRPSRRCGRGTPDHREPPHRASRRARDSAAQRVRHPRAPRRLHFRDPGLLEHALTHTSRANEDVSGGVFDNESLEFLGDAVLGFAIADLLFRRFPERDEGWKSKIKATLVSTSSLARLAEGLDLGEHLLLGRGEEKTGGRRKQALLADGYEALIAAIYLDGGVEQATAFIARQFASSINKAREPEAVVPRFQVGAAGAGAVGGRSAAGVRGDRRNGPGSPQDVSGRGACRRAERWPRRGAGARRKRSRKPRGLRCSGWSSDVLIDLDNAPGLAIVVCERRSRRRRPRPSPARAGGRRAARRSAPRAPPLRRMGRDGRQ